jgi:hypothetical protein
MTSKEESEMGVFDWLLGRSAQDAHQLTKTSKQVRSEEGCQSRCESYSLPGCCQQALAKIQRNSGLLAAVGVTMTTMQLMSNVDTKTPSMLLVNWKEEGEKAATTASTVAMLNASQALNNAVDHRDQHKQEPNSPPHAFWSRLVKRLMASRQLPPARRALEEAYDSID